MTRANIQLDQHTEAFFKWDFKHEPFEPEFIIVNNLQVVLWSGENLDHESLVEDQESINKAQVAIEKYLKDICRTKSPVVWED